MSDPVTQFSTGAIRDTQNGKPDLIETRSAYSDWRYCQYMTGKKAKYGEGNFKKGIPIESYLMSLERHVMKLRALYDCKKYNLPVADWMESHEDHAAAARFNIDGIMHEEEIAKLKSNDSTS